MAISTKGNFRMIIRTALERTGRANKANFDCSIGVVSVGASERVRVCSHTRMAANTRASGSQENGTGKER